MKGHPNLLCVLLHACTLNHTGQTILPILSRLLGDAKGEVRQTAGEALKGVASLMRPADLGQYVLTIVLQLAHDDTNEELVSRDTRCTTNAALADT